MASNWLKVTIRDTAHAGQFLDAAIAAGAEQIDVEGFGVDDLEPVKDQARELAAKQARRRAELLAEAAGAKLGAVVTMSETPPPGNEPWREGRDRYVTVNDSMAAGEPSGVIATAEDGMEPGLIEVAASLYVEYELR